MARKIAFSQDEIYHVCNRGTEKRNIFMDDKDRFRFIHDLYEFNDKNPAPHPYDRSSRFSEAKLLKIKREPIVSILAYTLMPNHFHLLIQQQEERGITNFMHKLGTGYVNYFNEKLERVGRLFQGTFKAVLVEREAHMTHLPFYIHANPLDLKFPEWREGKIRDPEQALKFLEEYRWSSFPDYIGKKNFPSVIDKKLLTEMIGSPRDYRAATRSLLKEMNLEKVRDVALEDLSFSEA